MATFLNLVNDLERESGTIQQGSRLSTVVGAVGRQEKMVQWVSEARRMIQVARGDWPWMVREFEAPLPAGTARITAAALGLSDVRAWSVARNQTQPFTIYDPAIGRQDETELFLTPYDTWRLRWDRGAHTPNRPCEISRDAQNRLCFGPTTNKALTLRGEYHAKAQTLTADSDVPTLPEDHHRIILYRAMMLMGDHDEAPAVVQTAMAKYQTALRNLVDEVFPIGDMI